MATVRHTISAIITNINPGRNRFPSKTSEKLSVEKMLYTFDPNCVILTVHAPGWADPGKPNRYRNYAGISPKKAIQGRILDKWLLVCFAILAILKGVTVTIG